MLRRLPIFLFATVIFFPMFASSSLAQDTLLATKGKLLLDESFSNGELDSRWATAKGEWKIVDGALVGSEIKADQHAAVIRTNIELPKTFVMQFDFKFDGSKALHCSFNGRGHICRATLTPTGYVLKGEKDKKDAKDKSVTVGQVKQTFEKGRWYTMTVEVSDNDFVARVDDGPVAFGTHEKIGRAKNNFGFPTAGVSSQIDNIKVWSADRKQNWEQTRGGLPVNKITPPAPRTAKQRFASLDKDKNNELSLKEFVGIRPEDKQPSAEKAFKRKDKDKSDSLSLEEYAATNSPKKK